MGLGKTIQVIALHLHEAEARPSTARRSSSARRRCSATGQREIERFAPGIPVRRYHGGGRHLDDLAPRRGRAHHLRHCCGATPRRWPRWRGAWSSPTRPSTPRTRCPAPPRRCGPSRRRRRIALTGTPVENRLTELWAILDWTVPGPARPARDVPPRRRRARRARPRPGGHRAVRRAWSARSCCAGARPIPASRPTCRRRPRPTGSCRSPPSRPRSTRRSCARRWRASARPRASSAGAWCSSCSPRSSRSATTRRSTSASGARSPAAPASSTRSTSWSTSSPPRATPCWCSPSTSRWAAPRAPPRTLAASAACSCTAGSTAKRARRWSTFQAGEAPVFLLSLKAGGTGLTSPAPPTSSTTTAGGTRRSRTRPPTGPGASARTGRCRSTASSPRARSRTASRRCSQTSGTWPSRWSAPARRGSRSCPTTSWPSSCALGAGLMARRRRDAPRPAAPTFGATWWGRAWVDALEHRARLDPNRLPRGPHVRPLEQVSRLDGRPGRGCGPRCRGAGPSPTRCASGCGSSATTSGSRCSRPSPRRAANAAALLDGELDPGVAEAAAAAGRRPAARAPASCSPRCSCPDWADPCKHSAAVCYLVADALDADPFALLPAPRAATASR